VLRVVARRLQSTNTAGGAVNVLRAVTRRLRSTNTAAACAREPAERTRRAWTRPDPATPGRRWRRTVRLSLQKSGQDRTSANDVIEELVREADDRALLAGAEVSWRRLASNPAALAAYRHETRALTAFDAQPQGE
jgi:hypothetical protein